MRKYIELNKNWLFRAKENENGKAFSDTNVNLPFFHSADTMTEGSFTQIWIPEEEDDGKTVYLEFSQVSGDIEIFCNGNPTGTHKGGNCSFRQLLSLEVKMGEEYKIEVFVTPKARTDNMFVFAGISLIVADSSHFNMANPEKNIYVECKTEKNRAEISVTADIVRPNNYDVVSYTVTDMKGETVFSKTCKPTEPDMTFSIENPELWDGQSGAYLYKLNAKLLRDSQCLDEINVPFGLREITLNPDGFLYLNGFRLPLCGVTLTDCSAVKSDIKNITELDGNILMSGLLPSRTNLLSLTDETGMLFWYMLPFSDNRDEDINALKEFLFLYRNHPSLSAVVCDTNADEAYFTEVKKVLEEYAPSVKAVIKRNIETAASEIPAEAEIVMLNVSFNTQPDAFISIGGRFSDLQELFTDKYFAINPINPLRTELSAGEHDAWHIRLWTAFYRQRNIIAYFGGFLSDGKTATSVRGLTGNDRSVVYDSFWYYRSQFSPKSFIKICDPEEYETQEKYIEIKCITNCKNLRILINGRDKNLRAEKITDGVYTFRQIKLKKENNLIEVSADDECDSIEILRY